MQQGGFLHEERATRVFASFFGAGGNNTGEKALIHTKSEKSNWHLRPICRRWIQPTKCLYQYYDRYG